MEVHPPDHPVMTWKQFFVHMAIVVLGLLIAIGLEQSVEGLHRRGERLELREALHGDLETMARNAQPEYRNTRAEQAWLSKMAFQAQQAILQHTTLPAPPPPPVFEPSEQFADSSYQAAKASGLLALLTQNELRAWDEVNYGIVLGNEHYEDIIRSHKKLGSFWMRFGKPWEPNSNWSHASEADLREYATDLGDASSDTEEYSDDARTIYGAAKAMADGELDLPKIQRAERNPMPAK